MKKKRTGRPITDTEREGRTCHQLIHYGLKMGIAANAGGIKAEDQTDVIAAAMPEYLRRRGCFPLHPQELVDCTTTQAAAKAELKTKELIAALAGFTAEKIREQAGGFRRRQQGTIAELETRLERLREAYEQSLTSTANETAVRQLQIAIGQLLGGTSTPSPDAYVLTEEETNK